MWRLGRLPSSSKPTEGILKMPVDQSEEAAYKQRPLQRVWVTTEIFPSGQGRGLEACLPHSDLWLQGRPGFPRIKYSSMHQLQPKGLPFWQVALFGFCSLTVTCFLIVGVGKHGCSPKKCPSLLECYAVLSLGAMIPLPLTPSFHKHLLIY